MNKLKLKNEDLHIDWISFNFEGVSDATKIAKALHEKNFKVIRVCEDESKISYSAWRPCRASIRFYKSREWSGSILSFSGKNADYFFKHISSDKTDWPWKFLENSKLGRVDICHQIDYTNLDKQLFDNFLISCRNKVKNKTSTKYFKISDNPKGKMLKINQRNNSVHFRLYQADKTDDKDYNTDPQEGITKGIIRFELELKSRSVTGLGKLLLLGNTEEFENQLVEVYYRTSRRFLDLSYYHTDWVIDYIRRSRDKNLRECLVSSYINHRLVTHPEEEQRLFKLLQFLSFLRNKKLSTKINSSQFIEIKFLLKDFIQSTTNRSYNQDERDKLINYFKDLQKLDPIVEVFSETAFQSYNAIPRVRCFKDNNLWQVEMQVAKELILFSYHFQFPASFMYASNRNEMRVRIFLIKGISTYQTEKILELRQFYDSINVDNRRLRVVKVNIIELLNELFSHGLIQEEIRIITEKKRIKLGVKDLQISNLSRRTIHIILDEKV